MTPVLPTADPARALLEPFLDMTRVPALLDDPVVALWGRPVRIAACEVAHAWRRTFAKPEAWRRSHLRVCYRLVLEERDARYSAFVHGVATLTDGVTDGGESTVVRIGGATLRLRRFPDDDALPRLAELAMPAHAAVRIAHLFGRTAAAAPAVDVLRYRPGERCVLRIDDGEPRFVKAHAGTAGERVWAHLRALHSQQVPVAEPLAWDPATQSVWQRWISRTGPGTLTGGRVTSVVLEGVGDTLARLHAAALPGLAVASREALLHDTRKRAVKLAQLFPALTGDLSAVIGWLTGQCDALPAPRPVPVHGDMHLDQCLLAEDRVLLADLDELAAGDAEQDLAALCVDFRLRAASPAAGDAWTEVVTSARRQAAVAAAHPRLLAWHLARHAIDKAYRCAWRELPASDAPVARLVGWAREAVAAPHAVAA